LTKSVGLSVHLKIAPFGHLKSCTHCPTVKAFESPSIPVLFGHQTQPRFLARALLIHSEQFDTMRFEHGFGTGQLVQMAQNGGTKETEVVFSKQSHLGPLAVVTQIPFPLQKLPLLKHGGDGGFGVVVDEPVEEVNCVPGAVVPDDLVVPVDWTPGAVDTPGAVVPVLVVTVDAPGAVDEPVEEVNCVPGAVVPDDLVVPVDWTPGAVDTPGAVVLVVPVEIVVAVVPVVTDGQQSV